MLDHETDQLLDAGDFGAVYVKAKLSVTLWEKAASGSLEHAEAMSNASVLAIRLSLPNVGITYARDALRLYLAQTGVGRLGGGVGL